MVLYFANPSTDPIRDAIAGGQLGAILTPKQYLAPPSLGTICIDNGCGPGSDGKQGKGYPGDAAFQVWIESLAHFTGQTRFVVAPDVVGDAGATWERSQPWLPRIRNLGFRAALVAQDGLENLPIPWEDFDVLFIGGSTEWKLGEPARDIVSEAVRREVPVHMGRVNSYRRVRYAHDIGCSTADGTFLRFGPDKNLPKVRGWMNHLYPELNLPT